VRRAPRCEGGCKAERQSLPMDAWVRGAGGIAAVVAVARRPVTSSLPPRGSFRGAGPAGMPIPGKHTRRQLGAERTPAGDPAGTPPPARACPKHRRLACGRSSRPDASATGPQHGRLAGGGAGARAARPADGRNERPTRLDRCSSKARERVSCCGALAGTGAER